MKTVASFLFAAIAAVTAAFAAPTPTQYVRSGVADNVLQSPIVGSTTAPIYSAPVASIAALRALNVTTPALVNGASIQVSGYYAANDGGGGTYVWNSASTAADNGGTVIQATGVTTGRWVLQYFGEITAKQFGCHGDGSTDDTTAMQNLATFVGSIGGNIRVVFSGGIYPIASTINWNAGGAPTGVKILGKGDAQASGSSVVQILFTGGASPAWWFKDDASFVVIENIGFLNGSEAIRFRPVLTYSPNVYHAVNSNRISHCVFQGQTTASIFLGFDLSDTTSDADMDYQLIEDCAFQATSAPAAAVVANDKNNGYRLMIKRCTIYSSPNGIKTQGWKDVTVEDCAFGQAFMSTYGINCVSGGGFFVANNLYTESPLVAYLGPWVGYNKQAMFSNVHVNTSNTSGSPAIDCYPYATFFNVGVNSNPVTRTINTQNGANFISQDIQDVDSLDGRYVPTYLSRLRANTTGGTADHFRWERLDKTIQGLINDAGNMQIGSTLSGATDIQNQNGQVGVRSTTGFAGVLIEDDQPIGADVGSLGVTFTGRSNNTGTRYVGARITARKANATVDNADTYIVVQTTKTGVGERDAVKVDADGNVRAILNGSAYYERGRSLAMGTFASPVYDAANFTASSGSWTVDSGDVNTYEYEVTGNRMTVIFNLTNTSVSATPQALFLKIPASATCSKATVNPIAVQDNGATYETGVASINAGATQIYIYRAGYGSTNWSTSTNQTHVQGEISFEIQ